ncbi:MAG: hypothetical protein AB8H80_14085 [Planctomycetota bacterium]
MTAIESQPDTEPQATNRPRVIAVGASNLTRFLPCLARVARGHFDSAVEVVTALGFGRSYGKSSAFLGRELPGIDQCGLWDALARDAAQNAAASATAASARVERSTGMVMDIGNDIFYDVLPETVVEWVGRAMQKLRPHVQRLVLAGIPPTVADIGKVRYALMRKFLVPSCQMELGEGLRRAAALHEGLRELARQYDAEFFEHPYPWFGWDAIHIKRRYWRAFSEALLGVPRSKQRGGVPTLRLRTAAPAWRQKSGREQVTQQPSVRMRDGSTFAIY